MTTKKKIDKEAVYRLACIQCTHDEIAHVVDCSITHLRKHFGKIIEKGKDAGKKSLRRAQWDKAINGDPRMQIFLGKQYLGQKDIPEDRSHQTPLPWNDEE